MKHKTRGSAWSLAILAVFAAGALVLLLMRQSVVDHVTVWQYEPSSAIEDLAMRASMSDHGKFLFYASTPKISDRDEFNQVCANQDSSTAVLGCYTGGNIYIYDITDPKLDGIKAVTAAHEMLHAAYERLSEDERASVNRLVEEQYAELQKKDDLAERMAVYAKTEPGQRDNELHSLLATEISDLSPELEKYFGQYFDDRAALVELYSSYHSVFETLEAMAQQLNERLTALQAEIERRSEVYARNVAQLNRDIAAFNTRADNGSFASEAAFNAERARLVARGENLATERQAINDLIDQFNSLNAQLADIANQTKALNQSINSSLPAAPRL